MTKFLDGPAAGQLLQYRRAPLLLRVVQSNRGNFDVLDQPEDEARKHERIFLYILAEKPRYMHMRCSNPSADGMFADATYKTVPDPPPDEVLRNNPSFFRWCGFFLETNTPAWSKVKNT